MSVNQSLVRYGVAGGTVINVDHSRIETGASVKIQLSASYAIERAPGTPSRPSMTGCAVANLDYPRTVASSQVITVLKAEADALVAAGKAALV